VAREQIGHGHLPHRTRCGTDAGGIRDCGLLDLKRRRISD
jgi:hypothetical protein